MERKRRVRFAPSPTGPLHMGGVRTALYNYLYARQAGGDFVLRIEDTDSQRFVPGAEEYIIEALRWCGIYPDEGVDENGKVVETPSEKHPHAPYRQSQRRGIYRQYAEQLVKAGYAYYAFDTPEELAALRAEAESRKETFIYNWKTRGNMRNSLTLPEDEVARLVAEDTGWTIRFKIPENRTVVMEDLIRGHIEVNSNTLDDKVLWKRVDELPTYHLANIVDDHLMEITEVIRGEEWLPSLPLHYLLYEAFGWTDTQPRFAHLSLLLKPDGKGKLSKRDGDRLGFPVFPLKWVNAEGEVSRGYREDGYYPEAFINMLALLGWNPGNDRELFTVEELVPVFNLDRVIKSGARFNADKAKWFNQEYLRMRPLPQLVEDFKACAGEKLKGCDDGYISAVVELMRERAHFVTEMWNLTSFFFEAPESYDEASVVKFWNEDAKAAMPQVRSLLADLASFDKETIENSLHELITSNQWPMGKVMNSLRLFLVGVSKGPGVADMMALFGKDETLRRIDSAVSKLS
ncbi:MAG: glutamate--tRNA ligase [Bacteroidales bacterium]|nr:glutamate--tRNA ligase [Candidatus Cacconaster scatequi]